MISGTRRASSSRGRCASEQEGGTAGKGIAGIYRTICGERLKIAAGDFAEKRIGALTHNDIKPSLRKYPFIDFKFEREIGNDYLQLSKG